MKVYIDLEQVEFNCLSRLLGCASSIILMTFLCKVKKFPLLKKLSPQNYSILYNRMEVFIVN